MCLAAVYKNEQKPENLIVENVARIECMDGQVLLTDLMGRKTAVEGRLLSVDLMENITVIQTIS